MLSLDHQTCYFYSKINRGVEHCILCKRRNEGVLLEGPLPEGCRTGERRWRDHLLQGCDQGSCPCIGGCATGYPSEHDSNSHLTLSNTGNETFKVFHYLHMLSVALVFSRRPEPIQPDFNQLLIDSFDWLYISKASFGTIVLVA